MKRNNMNHYTTQQSEHATTVRSTGTGRDDPGPREEDHAMAERKTPRRTKTGQTPL